MNQQFISYLSRVVDVLNAHADKNEAMADMINLTAKAIGQDGNPINFNASQSLKEMAEVLREHSEYIQEVIDEPHLLITQ